MRLLTIAVLSASCLTAFAEWNPTTSLPAPRWYPGCCAYDGYVYVTGGEQSGANSTVWYAEAQPDGSLGTWVSTTSLPAGRMYHGCVAHDGYVYVTGGYGGGSYRNTVWSSQIQPDGSLGAWQTVTSLPAARSGFGTVVHDGYLYVLGGYNGSSDYPSVWFVPIGDSGTLDAWDSTTTLPAAYRCSGSCAYQGFLYVTGGFSWEHLPVAHNQVWYAPTQPDGSLGAWQTATNLPAARYGHPCCACDGRLLLTGGQTAFSYYRTVWHGNVGDSGTVDLWTATDDLPEARTGHGSCTDSGYLYVVGGVNGTGNLGTVRYADIDLLVGIEQDAIELAASPLRLKVTPSVVSSGRVRIEYQATGAGRVPVRLDVHDAAGRLVQVLVAGKPTPGRHHVRWSPSAPGTYFLRLSSAGAVATEKITVLGK